MRKKPHRVACRYCCRLDIDLTVTREITFKRQQKLLYQNYANKVKKKKWNFEVTSVVFGKNSSIIIRDLKNANTSEWNRHQNQLVEHLLDEPFQIIFGHWKFKLYLPVLGSFTWLSMSMIKNRNYINGTCFSIERIFKCRSRQTSLAIGYRIHGRSLTLYEYVSPHYPSQWLKTKILLKRETCSSIGYISAPSIVNQTNLIINKLSREVAGLSGSRRITR